ncbi:DNA/RNA non-specific endonuclease [Sphingobium yanoikuyae]|uniref:LysM peptidoglycan-binding domain-containing protein n=1 Tax=Sphingobium yanoikuyae TaxID=13690 RepID=UPI0022DD13B9|nr:DNA/RNA non-specific endonuclease [Sphingobium yanoikuyae]WBQ16352.1 DNA/RNA non-specific endonuclease [Sphingobium yanoikuyae]
MTERESVRSNRETAFSLYLRTGRRIGPDAIEVKFNPWHDEENGRFTFRGQGRYFSATGGNANVPSSRPGGTRVARPSSPLATRRNGAPDRDRFRADHPANHSLYMVKQGDTLSRIAAQRQELTAADLAWLNNMLLDRPLQIGQRLNLPPDPADPPSLESQLLNSNWQREVRNGYAFDIDVIARPREIIAELTDGPIAKRSRQAQAQTGQPDRRPGDDGGHFIAARFNGPGDSFNHFAQDRNFNRGAYRAMEDGWTQALRDGKNVVVHIVPVYEGASKRPYRIHVTWRINGVEEFRDFSNERKGRRHER